MGALTVKQPHSFENRHGAGDIFWNFLAILVLVGIVAMGGCFITTYANPHSNFNLIPAAGNPKVTPQATLPSLVSPTPTSTTIKTSTIPAEPSGALASRPVPANTDVPVELAPKNDPYPAPLGQAATFVLRNALAAISGEVIHPDLKCQWTGVGGQAFDLQGRPLVQMNVRLKGKLDGRSIDLLSLTGTETEYGPAGYEFTLGDKPVASKGTLTVQLVDPNGLPLSSQIDIDTYANCDSNLVLVNFKQVK